MLQVFVLSELFLVICACYLLADAFGSRILFLINIRSMINSGKKGKLSLLGSGFLLVALLCFVPMSPGPVFLGDFIPVFNIIVLLFYFVKRFSTPEENIPLRNKKRDALGYITLCIALLHFLFPSAVLL